MASKNPKRSRKAMMETGTKTSGGFVAKVLTLGVSVILEDIDNPVADGVVPTKAREMMEFMFVMTHPATESQQLLAQGRDVFNAATIAWASEVDMGEVRPLAEVCCATLKRLNAVSGGSGGSEKNAR